MDKTENQGGGGIQRKFLTLEVKAAKERGPNVLTFRGTTKGTDRDGDVLHPDGVDLKNYLKNPLFLWAHDWHGRPPIGKAVDVRVEKTGIDFDIQFDEGDPFAMDVKRKYENGYLNAVSVGFVPTEMEEIRDKETNAFTGLDFKKWELLELSGVPIPANPEALQLAYSKFLDQVEAHPELLDEKSADEGEPKTKNEGDEYVTTDFFTGAVENILAEIRELEAKMVAQTAPTEDEGGDENEEDRLQRGLSDLGYDGEEAVRLLSERAPETDQSVAKAARTLLLGDAVQKAVQDRIAYKAGKAWTLKKDQ